MSPRARGSRWGSDTGSTAAAAVLTPRRKVRTDVANITTFEKYNRMALPWLSTEQVNVGLKPPDCDV